MHVDPSRDGSVVVMAVYDRGCTEFFHGIGTTGLLTSHASL
ncbi:short-chain dehydrogenase/reductase [Streptomyces sp. Ac-502]